MVDCIPWNEFEIKYAELSPGDIGNVAKPHISMALGAFVIQDRFLYSERELVEQLTETPYLQYFIGLPGYQGEPHLMQVHWFFFANVFLPKCW